MAAEPTRAAAAGRCDQGGNDYRPLGGGRGGIAEPGACAFVLAVALLVDYSDIHHCRQMQNRTAAGDLPAAAGQNLAFAFGGERAGPGDYICGCGLCATE